MVIEMTAMIVNGNEIAKEIRKKIFKDIIQLKKKYNITPMITTVIVGNDSSSKLYLKLRDNACKEVGIISKHCEFDAKISEQKIFQTIQKLNVDNSVHGILIQYPVPKHLSQEKLIQVIDQQKDIEGFNPVNLGRTLIGDEYLVPCTPLSVLTILEHEHITLKGKDIVIVNHSNVVGKPLAALLLNRNATVVICHVFTKNLKQYTSKADILITGAGVPKLITTDHIKDNAIVIDVGIVETKEGIRGDVDFDSVKEKAAILTPVPGGVGPVTIACALKNIVKTYKNCIENM
ncbi:Bifunctional protein FolD protein [uncultured archaeon]|nr:Bifunctional protein FolD protein [uncultured archaeon]